jgi:hypothetical protein
MPTSDLSALCQPALFAITLGLGLFSHASAQEIAVAPGERVRVTGLCEGAGLGALTAALLRTERWIDLPLGRVHLTIVK